MTSSSLHMYPNGHMHTCTFKKKIFKKRKLLMEHSKNEVFSENF